MNDDQYQLEDRLRKMKAMTFCEERQTKLVKRIFNVLALRSKERLRKYDEYYNMILCLKSFKGFMEFAIIKREEQRRLRETQQMEMRNAKEEERVEKLISDCERNRKAKTFRKFCLVVREKIRLREQRKSKESFEQKLKKQELIHKNIQEESVKRPVYAYTQAKFFKEQKSQINFLENSRRDVSSAGYLTQDLQAKRKFAAIKALPPKPLISEEKEQKKQTKKAIKNEQFHRAEHSTTKSNEENRGKQMNNPSNKTIHLPQPSQISEFPFDQPSLNKSPTLPQPSKRSPSPDLKQQSSRTILSKKDQILALLSELKMVQILTLQGFIEQNTRSIKNQTSLIEKRHIRQSLAMLERISLLS